MGRVGSGGRGSADEEAEHSAYSAADDDWT
jgi:hypothetical protein